MLLVNEKLSFNEQKKLLVMLQHIMSSSNTNNLQFVLFDNFNNWVLLKKTHKLTLHVMDINYLILILLFRKLVLLVFLKIL